MKGRTMRILYFMLSLCCLFAGSAQAEVSAAVEDKVSADIADLADGKIEAIKEEMSDLVKELNLTPEQQEKAKQLSEQNRLKTEKIVEGMNDLRKQIRDLEDSSMNEFTEILTDEQKEKFAEFRALRNDERAAHDEALGKVLEPLGK